MKTTTRTNKGLALGSLTRLMAVLSLLATCILVAFAAGWECDPFIPRCPGCNVNQECENGEGTIGSCDYWEGFWYACAGKASQCPNEPGKCNIWVKTEVKGWFVTCLMDEEDDLYGFCAYWKGNPIPLNKKCEGGPCDPTLPEDSVPPLLEGYPGDTGYSPWSIVWEGSIPPNDN